MTAFDDKDCMKKDRLFSKDEISSGFVWSDAAAWQESRVTAPFVHFAMRGLGSAVLESGGAQTCAGTLWLLVDGIRK